MFFSSEGLTNKEWDTIAVYAQSYTHLSECKTKQEGVVWPSC